MGRIKAWIDEHFIDNWFLIWRDGTSMRFAAVFAALVGVVVQFPSLLIFLFQLGPGRPMYAVIAVVIAYGIVAYVRLRRDKKLKGVIEDGGPAAETNRS